MTSSRRNQNWRALALSMALMCLLGAEAQSQDGGTALDLNKMLEEQKRNPSRPKPQPVKRPAAKEKIDYMNSEFSTSFPDFEGSVGELATAGQNWVRKMDNDWAYRRLCGRFNYLVLNKRPLCTPANKTCQFSIQAENCIFVPKFQSCPSPLASRYSPDHEHQDFKICTKSPGSSGATGPNSYPGVR